MIYMSSTLPPDFQTFLVSVHKVPFAALRSSENYSFTMSKLRIFGLRKPCNWHFLNRHTYCENIFVSL
jgi:hypothetical protein